jgi:hypothetical protein
MLRLLVIALLAVSACYSKPRLYEGPRRSRKDVAQIYALGYGGATGNTGDMQWMSRIVAVNGRELEKPVRAVEVLPGKYTLAIHNRKYIIPEWVITPSSEEAAAWEYAGEETKEYELDVKAGYEYRMEYPTSWSGLQPFFSEVPPN